MILRESQQVLGRRAGIVIAPLALSHALLTVAVLYALNDAVTLRVGAAFGR